VKHSAYTLFIADKMGSEKFCLRWNDFEKNISSAFKELRDDKDFFDVTLACEDEQIKGHKVILAACSPFFRNILRRNQHEHPLLYMKGVKYTDLQAVLNFMYHGEVNVAQEELNSFLSVAEDLRVKGLTQNTAEAKQLKRSEPAVVSRDNHREQPTLPRTPHPVPDQDIQEVVPIKSEPLPLVNQDRHHISRQPQPQVYTTLPENQTVVTYQEETGYEDYGDYQDQMYTEEDISMDHNRTMQTGSAVKGPELPWIYTRMMGSNEKKFQSAGIPLLSEGNGSASLELLNNLHTKNFREPNSSTIKQRSKEDK